MTFEEFHIRMAGMGLWTWAKRMAERQGATMEEVFGTSRYSHVQKIREAIWVRLRGKPFNFSYPVIGKLFNRDHTTIITGVRKFNERKAKT